MKDFVDSLYILKAYDGINSLFINNDDKLNNIVHYTSTQVLDSLLNSATFWASNIFYLNDASEYFNGIDKLNDVLSLETKRFLKAPSLDVNSMSIGLYTLSFSNDSDLLQQWITYAKESGICIELDKRLLDEKYNIGIVFDENKSDSIHLKYFPINVSKVIHNSVYKFDETEINETKLSEIFNDVMHQSTKENELIKNKFQYWNDQRYRINQLIFLRLVASYIKNPDFSIENEIRASFLALCNANEKVNIKYFRKPNGVLRPYCETVFLYEDNPMLPLKSIVIGPSGNQRAVFDSIVHRIKYGKKCVWNYWEQNNKKLFKDNFYDYVWGSISRFLTENLQTIDKNVARDITTKLKQNWVDERKVLCNENVRWRINWRRWDELKPKELNYVDSLKRLDTDYICSEIRKNNYFSQEGIWIKKSKIPYIF